MYRCESRSIKKAECWKIDAFELWCWKSLESPLDCKEIQPVHPKGNQPWIFIARTDAEAAAPILWPPDVKSLLIGKDPDAGKDWGQEEKEVAEDEMVGWHHRFNGREFEQTLGDGGRQGSLVCCIHGVKKSRTWLRDWTTTTKEVSLWWDGYRCLRGQRIWGLGVNRGRFTIVLAEEWKKSLSFSVKRVPEPCSEADCRLHSYTCRVGAASQIDVCKHPPTSRTQRNSVQQTWEETGRSGSGHRWREVEALSRPGDGHATCV